MSGSDYKSWKNFETSGQAFSRVRQNGPRKPLRTLAELADEFGVSWRTLNAMRLSHEGPNPILKTGSQSKRATWFDPGEMRSWWASIQEKRGAA